MKNIHYIHVMTYTNASFYITKIKVSAGFGTFSADTDSSKDSRYLPIPIFDHNTTTNNSINNNNTLDTS